MYVGERPLRQPIREPQGRVGLNPGQSDSPGGHSEVTPLRWANRRPQGLRGPITGSIASGKVTDSAPVL